MRVIDFAEFIHIDHYKGEGETVVEALPSQTIQAPHRRTFVGRAEVVIYFLHGVDNLYGTCLRLFFQRHLFSSLVRCLEFERTNPKN